MSRKLDMAIAETLGYKWPEDRCRVCGWPIVPDGEAGCWKDNCSQRPLPAKRADEEIIPRYSTDGNAMLELDAEMRTRGWSVHVGYSKVSQKFYIRYSRWDKKDGLLLAHGKAETEPHARALAAYKALTGREWEEKEEGENNV